MSVACPNCGNQKEQMKDRCRSCGVSVIEITVRDGARSSDRAGYTLASIPGKGPAIDVQVYDPSAFGVSTKVDASGKLTLSASGDPPQNEEGSGQSTAVLVSRLKERGNKSSGPIKRHPDPHSAVDCTCSIGDETFNFQIT